MINCNGIQKAGKFEKKLRAQLVIPDNLEPFRFSLFIHVEIKALIVLLYLTTSEALENPSPSRYRAHKVPAKFKNRS